MELNYELVPVDAVGKYENSVGMNELYHCAGVFSIEEDSIYAAHLTPGRLGREPEKVYREFNQLRGENSFSTVLGLNVDPNIEEILKDENPERTFTSSSFVVTPQDNIYTEVKEKEEGLLTG